MQIMPQTGKTIARSLNARLRTSNQLLEPATSIRFGSHYLRSLLDKFSGHPALASAAYNAGPRRVERWVSASEVVPGDVWVDTVPFTETREYVRRVFAYTVIYERRLGQQTRRLSDRLLPVLRNQVLSLANVSVRDNPETSNRLRPGRTLDGAVFTRRDPNLELRTSD
jgi:soluble lytic murein transglycosylase